MEAGATGGECSGPGDWQYDSQQGRRAGPVLDGYRSRAERLGTRWDVWAEQSEDGNMAELSDQLMGDVSASSDPQKCAAVPSGGAQVLFGGPETSLSH